MLLLLPIALISGILTSLSPCVIPILPVILASGIDGNRKRIRGIIVGLVVSFTVFALLLSVIVSALGISPDTIRIIAVVLLILFGVTLTFPSIWDHIQNAIERVWRVRPAQAGSGFWGGALTGVTLGAVWTPCIGPIVASVASLAALDGLSLSSILLVFFYALGSGITLYVIARGGEHIGQRMQFIRENAIRMRRIFGVIIIATGILIGVGVERAFQTWALNTIPEAWSDLPSQFEERFNVQDTLNHSVSEPAAESAEVVNRNVALQKDFDGAKVARRDLLQGCPFKDCIPSIEDPSFETATVASGWMRADDVVFAVHYNGVERAYPQRILNWHEIVNDDIGGDPIAVTFCPLCGSAVAFERRVDGVITEFGVSGKLHNNDLVMYDRYEGNLWQQITGEGIVGPAARRDEVLTQVPILTTTWDEWVRAHPKTEVLSRDTGFSRDYDQYPYGTYEEDGRLLFGMPGVDESLHIKQVVYGVELSDGTSKAYPEERLTIGETIDDTIGSTSVEVARLNDGTIRVTNQTTGEELIPIRLFWFAWAAFHPGTEIYVD